MTMPFSPTRLAPIVTARIQTLAHCVQCRARGGGLNLPNRVAPELLAKNRGDEAGHAFHRLQRNIAHESIADDDIRLAVEDTVALNVADVVELAATQQLRGLAYEVIALDVL